MTKKVFFLTLTAVFALVFLMSACNNGKNVTGESPEAVYTKAAQTVAAQLTNMASDTAEDTETTPTPEPTEALDFTPTPNNELPTATEKPDQQATATVQQPTKSGSCTLLAEFVSDVTIPDDTVLSPGEAFTKTWQIINEGSCTWGEGYTIFFTSGDNLGAPESVTLTRGVAVAEGKLINVSINLVAPAAEGTYRADFKFKDSSGKIFGTGSGGNGSIYVQIIVKAPTPVPSKTPTITPTATITPTP